MANKIGQALTKYDSRLLSGPLGVVQVGFKGWDLGKTTAQTQLTPDLNIKEILYQQFGTKAADHVITGADMMVEATFGEISTELLKLLVPYLIASGGSAGDGNDSGTLKTDLYESMLETVAGGLRLVSVNAQGVPSEEDEDVFSFYNAIPLINGALIQWEADTQRNLPVNFMIKRRILTPAESTTHESVYGYYGDPTQEDLPAIDWPDVAAPVVIKAEATAATTLEITFDENVTEVAGITEAEKILCRVNGEFKPAVSAAAAGALYTVTFGAGTFTNGDVVTLFLAQDTVEDTATTPNKNEALNDYPVLNSVP